MKRENKVTFYRNFRDKPIPGWEVRAASPKREWMDTHKHMYRCLPMTIANQNGWVIQAPCDISTIWFGGSDTRSMHFWLDPKYNVPNAWVKCHFLGGIVTFEFDFLIKTNPGTNLLVRGAPNFYVDGAHPLEGVVETDWLDFTFTMNWKVTEPNKLVTFRKGDPICFVQPIPHNYAETFDFEIKYLDEDTNQKQNFEEYLKSRTEFSNNRKTGNEKEEWQKHYFNGLDVYGNKISQDMHTIKLNIVDPVDQKLETFPITQVVEVSQKQVEQKPQHTDTINTINLKPTITLVK